MNSGTKPDIESKHEEESKKEKSAEEGVQSDPPDREDAPMEDFEGDEAKADESDEFQ